MQGILILAALGGIYGLVYYLNHKTPVPKGCEEFQQACHGCKDFACANHPDNQ